MDASRLTSSRYRAEAAEAGETGCAYCAGANVLYAGGGASRAKRAIIDVHAHLTPPRYVPDIAARFPVPLPTRAWSVEKHVEDMDRGEVATAILSVTTPGVWFGDIEEARRIARYTNNYAAELCQKHKGRFGQFTALPLPDIDGSLREIEHGLDQQKSDGVGLLTSYDGKYLGDPVFDPVFEELNRRKAVVYVHPTAPTCLMNLIPNLPDAAVEFGTDTTRAIGSYVFRGAAKKFPDITMIWSHAGGTMPFLIERFDLFEKMPENRASAPDGFRAAARKFFYDTAQASNAVSMRALTQVIPATQVVFGTDYPFRTASEHVKQLEEGGVFDAAGLAGIWRRNAGRFLSRLP